MPDNDDREEERQRPRVFLVDAETIGLEDDLHLEMPTSTSFNFSLIDHDNKECRGVTEDEIRPFYVDNEIATIGPVQPDPWTLSPDDIDKQELRITYTDGRELGYRLGDISKEPGSATTMFSQVDGIVFPIDEDGRFLMDATNTPLLSAVRRDFHAQLAQMAEDRLELAFIVAAFAQIIGLNSHQHMAF